MTKYIDNNIPEILIAPPGKMFIWDILCQKFHVCKVFKLRGDENPIPPISVLCGDIIPEYRVTLYSLRVLDTDTVCTECIEAKGDRRTVDSY